MEVDLSRKLGRPGFTTHGPRQIIFVNILFVMTARFSIDRCRIVDHCHRVLNKFVLLYFGLCRTLSYSVEMRCRFERVAPFVSQSQWKVLVRI